MQTKWLEDFICLARTRSFTRAAEERHVTHPAFGRRIRALEAWVGTPLIDRSGFPATLTAEGEIFLEAAQEMLRMLHETRDALRGRYAPGENALSIATGRTLSRTLLPGWVVGLHKDMGPFNVRISTGSMHDATLMLEQGNADLLLCYSHPQIAVDLAREEYDFVVMGKDTLIPVSAPDVSGLPLFSLPGAADKCLPYLSYARSLTLGRILEHFIADAHWEYHLDTVYEADFAEALLEFTRRGLGIAWLPAMLVTTEIKSGALVRAGRSRDDIPFEIRLYRARLNRKPLLQRLWSRLERTEETIAEAAPLRA